MLKFCVTTPKVDSQKTQNVPIKSLNSYFRDKDIELAENIAECLQEHRMAIIEGKPGTGKTSMARYVASNIRDSQVFFLHCGTLSKIESSIKDLARCLHVSAEITEIADQMKEIGAVMRGKSPQQYLLIFDNVCVNTLLRDLFTHLPENVKILITSLTEQPLNQPNKFTIDLYNYAETALFIAETTKCRLVADEHLILRASLTEFWNPLVNDITLPVRDVNQLAHFLNNIKVKKVPNHYSKKCTPLEIMERHINPNSIVYFVYAIFAYFKRESLEQVCRLLYLDGDFIDLDILTYPPHASHNRLLDSFLNQLQQYGVIHRTENCCGEKGISIHRSFQIAILQHLKCDLKKTFGDVLSTLEFYLGKIVMGGHPEALESRKAYQHALALRAHHNALTDPQKVLLRVHHNALTGPQKTQLLSCITEYQRFWCVDAELCIEIEHEKMQRVANWDDDNADVCDVYLSMAKSYLAFGKYADALESFKRVVAMRERKFGRGYHTIFSVLVKMAICEFKLGEYRNAVLNLETAMSILEGYRENTDVYLVMRNEMPAVYQVMGLCYDRLQSSERAKSFLKTSLKLKLIVDANDHKEVAEMYQNLAAFYATAGKKRKAILNYEGAGRHLVAFYGEDNLKVAAVCEAMAGLYEKKRLYAKARDCFRCALRIYARMYGDRHVKCPILAQRIGECEVRAKKIWNRIKSYTSSISLRGKRVD